MKPILFNTEMVRAILEGRKTVTRRVIERDIVNNCDMEKDGTLLNYQDCHGDFINPVKLCHYQVGDVLYVRKTWGCYDKNWGDAAYFMYRADYPDGASKYKLEGIKGIICDLPKWKPSIHMPKEAARIFLKVTDVRLERLQNITDEQALKEGVPGDTEYPISEVYCPKCHGDGLVGALSQNLGYMEVDCNVCDTAVKRFSHLWNSTIKKSELDKYSWYANPYVWVIEFERITEAEAQREE